MSNAKRDRHRAQRNQSRVAAAEADAAARRQRNIVLLLAGVLLVIGAVVAFGVLGGDDATTTDDAAAGDTTTDDATPAAGTGECPAEDHSSPRTIDFAGPPPMCIDPAETHVAVFDTSEGEVRVTLDTELTPGTTNNFVTLARWGYYDGTTLFRTDPSIDIIQGGSPHTESPADPGPGYTIPDEPDMGVDPDTGQFTGPWRYQPGQLVMARTGAPDSASAQFFFSTGPNTALLDSQGVYVVFGQADDAGLAVLQDIIALHEPGGSLGGAPSRTVTVNSVRIEVG